MSLLEELNKQEYWEETLDRMLKKENLTSEQQMEIILLNSMNFREQFIRMLQEKSYVWSIPTKAFLNKIGTTKKRVVYIYNIQDRYVLGVLYRVFSSYYKDRVSKQCFSYKRGMKTLNAIDYLKSDIDITKKYGVKLDIKAYFNSVNRDYLEKVVNEISDSTEIKYLLTSLLNDDRVYINGNLSKDYKSLIPGTAFSSFLANYCLRDLDNYIVDKCKLTYARYSDDIICFSDSLDELHNVLDIIHLKLEELGLKINEKKYEWFQPGDEIDFLGLKLKSDGIIDISDNSLRKFKKKIKHACRVGRSNIEIRHKDPYKEAKKIIKRHNHRVYKCFIQDASKFGWAYYAFRYINTLETLREIDFYMKDRLRQMITGHNNKANIRKVPDDKLKELGYVSLCEMYIKFKIDFDYYCDTVDLIRT